jgi:ubiquinone/menaquinone biosynthesis C-methylase UbiE
MGDTLRPGGFKLTDRGVQLCSLSSGDTILDLGCGRGATVNYLKKKHRIAAVGIDSSEVMIADAKEHFGDDRFFVGNAEQLPFQDESYDSVFAECTLSLMESMDSVIKQSYRVLKQNGWFVITDVYARKPEEVAKLGNYSAKSCMRGIHDLNKLRTKLEQTGFNIVYLEDFSQYLKELVVKIGFSYGSMNEFWKAATEKCDSKIDKKCDSEDGVFIRN